MASTSSSFIAVDCGPFASRILAAGRLVTSTNGPPNVKPPHVRVHNLGFDISWSPQTYLDLLFSDPLVEMMVKRSSLSDVVMQLDDTVSALAKGVESKNGKISEDEDELSTLTRGALHAAVSSAQLKQHQCGYLRV